MVTGAAVKEAIAGNGGGFGQLDRPLGDPVGEGRGMNAGNWTDLLGNVGQLDRRLGGSLRDFVAAWVKVMELDRFDLR